MTPPHETTRQVQAAVLCVLLLLLLLVTEAVGAWNDRAWPTLSFASAWNALLLAGLFAGAAVLARHFRWGLALGLSKAAAYEDALSVLVSARSALAYELLAPHRTNVSLRQICMN